MLQDVSSTSPLSKVAYHRRGDGLADVYIRTSISSRTIPAHDGMPESVEYTAKEAYIVSALTEHEVNAQADDLLKAYIVEHTPDSERIAALEQSNLDLSEMVASLYVAMTSMNTKEA